MKTLVYNLRNTTAQVTDAQSTLTINGATRSAANCANRGTTRVHRHSRPSFIARLFMTLTLLLTLGAGEIWADIAYSGGYIYFDNSIGVHKGCTQLCARQSSWTGFATLSNISNTKLYYVANPEGSGWGGILGWVIISNATCKSNDNWDNWSSSTWYTEWNTYGFNSGSTYLIVPSSTTGGKSVSTTYYSGGYSALNSTQTIKTQVSTDGGSNYSDANSKASISVTSYKMIGNGSVTKQTASISTSAKSTTVSAARTATTTLSYSSLNADYDFVGWYNGSTQVGTGTSYTYYPTAATTITAKFKQKQYTVNYGVNTSTRNGSITLNSGSAVTTTSSSTLNKGTSISFTATPNSGYQVEGWYSNAACTAGNKLQTGGNSYNAGTLTANVTVYVKFAVRTGGTVTLTAGTGGKVSKSGSEWAASASITNITSATAINIYAKANTGYTFSTWTKTEGSGSVSTNAANGKFTPVAFEDATVTASFTENKSTITVTTATTTAGSLKFGSTSKSWGTTASVGVATTQEITATAAAGFNFVRWELSGAATSTSTLTNPTITIKGNGTASSTGTATAVFEENLTTPYVIKGGTAITGGTAWTTEIAFTKKSGESTGTVAYAEIPITTALTGDTENANYNFKVVNGSNWYGIATDNHASNWWYNSDSGEQTLSTGGGNNDNIQLRANVVGTYIVKLDYSSTPKITITWPTALQIYRSSPTDGTNIGDHQWNSMPSATSYRWNLTLAANTTYEFKINDKGTYYGNNTLINTGISNRTFSTGTSDTKLKTKSAGTYVFTWDATNHKLTVVYPKSAVLTPETSVYSGTTVTLTGYASELGSGSHTITYEYYKGITLTDANKIATKTNTANATYQSTTQDVTVNFDGNTTSQVYTLQIKEGGSVIATNTVTVYRKWDIYVHDVHSWNAMYLYVYDNATNTYRDEWPGYNYSSSKYNGAATWYSVPLDAQYPHFILNNNEGNKQTFGSGTYATDIATFEPGSFWYVNYDNTGGDGKMYYSLQPATLSIPTVTLATPEVISATMARFAGKITNFGGDGLSAAEMKTVGIYIGDTKYTTTCCSNDSFFVVVPELTAGTTYSNIKAFAENVKGEGKSAAGSVTMPALSTYTIKVRASSQPYIYAWSYASGKGTCGEQTVENHEWPGIAMTSTGITGVEGTWYEYTSMNNTYNQFKITTGANNAAYDSNQTDNWAAPEEDKCYWYWNGTEKASHSNLTLGVMACPILEPTLMIESTAGSGSYTNYTMTTNGSNVEYTLSLLQEVTYKFKVIYNADYYTRTNSGDIFTGNHNSDINFSVLDGSGNEGELQTTVAGSYKISFNTSTKKVTVTYPTIPTPTGLSIASTLVAPCLQAFAGNGTSGNPFKYFQDKCLNIRVSVTGATGGYNIDDIKDHLYFKFGSTEQPSGVTAKNLTIDAPDDTDLHNTVIDVYFKYNGIEGPKATTTAYYQAITVPTLTLTAATSDVEKGHSTTLTATVTGGDGTEVGNNFSFYQKAPGVSGEWNYTTMKMQLNTTNTKNTGNLNTQGVYHFKASLNYHGRTFYFDEIAVNVYKVVTVKVGVQTSSGWDNLKFHWWTSAKSAVNTQAEYITAMGDTKWYSLTFRQPYPVSFVLYDGTGESGNNISFNESTHWHQSTDITNVNDDVCYIVDVTYVSTAGADKNKKTPTLKDDCDGFYRVHVEQPLYNDNGTANGNSHHYYSNIVSEADSVSFYTCHNATTFELQQFGNGGWTRLVDLSASRPAAANVTQIKGVKGGTNDHVYHAYFNGATLTGMYKYTGNLYIRSELATGRFDNYTDPKKDNKMTNFGPRVTYDYYWVKFSGNALKPDGTTPYGADYVSIDAMVGDNINPCLARHYSDNGDITGANMGKVSNRNVRYSYDSQTNWLDVAAIGESTTSAYTFLSIFGADSNNETPSTTVYMADGITATWEKDDTKQVKFLDLSNWTYQADVVVKKTTNNDVKVGIQARLDGTSYVQDIVPRSKPLVILGNESTKRNYTMRAIYDFKTNTIIAGWLPAATENIGTSTVNVEGNMILNRVERGSVQQIQTSGAGQVTGLQLLYTTLEIQRDNVNGDFYKVHGASGNDNPSTNLYYWISLPYECDIDSIFGIPGAYGDKWAICRYDGKSRARNGFWVDSDSYWKWLKLDPGEENNHIMKANEGYVLVLDLQRSDFQDINIKNSDTDPGTNYASIFVYFPSTGRAGKTFTLNNQTQSVTLEPYECTIPGRENYDSGWHMVGVPGFNDVTITSTDAAFARNKEIPAFYYEYVYDGAIYSTGSSGSSKNNAYLYHVNTNDTYKAFHGYCIQYNGTINWAAATTNKQAVPAARHAAANDGNTIRSAKIRLTLNDGDNELDNTYIALSSTATADFDFNLDLDKIINNNNPNIYTLYGEQPLGANCLPLETQTVPVGLQTIATADYTFALDSVPDGLQAILVDTEADTETDLSKDTYTVELDAGTYNSRFHIRLAPAAADIATELHSNTASGISATLTDDGRLLLNGMNDNGSDVSVFDPAGRLVYQQHTYRGQAINLPATQGVYLIRLGNEVLRVVK